MRPEKTDPTQDEAHGAGPTGRVAPDLATRRWAIALVALPIVTVLVCLPLKRESVALAVLPDAGGPLPLGVLGALWVVAPVAVLTLLAITARPRGPARPLVRALALVCAAWLGTASYLPPHKGAGRYYVLETFGAAAPRAEALLDGLAVGVLGIVGALLVTWVVLFVAFRKPAGWPDLSPQAKEERGRRALRRLGVLFLCLLAVVVVVAALRA